MHASTSLFSAAVLQQMQLDGPELTPAQASVQLMLASLPYSVVVLHAVLLVLSGEGEKQVGTGCTRVCSWGGAGVGDFTMHVFLCIVPNLRNNEC